MRWRVPGAAVVVAMVVAMALPAAAGPPPDVPPTIAFGTAQVSIIAGPTEPCSDGIYPGAADVDLQVEDPDGGEPVEVGYVAAGDAVPGVDFEPLPPSLRSTDQLELRAAGGADPAGSTATLTIALQPGTGYVVAEPSTLTVTFTHLDHRCDAPTFAAVASNSAQTIAVGEVPVPLQLVDPINGVAFAALIGGRLPPGIALTRDGSFTGAARSPGTFVATVGSCRTAFVLGPGLCTEATLTVTVLGNALARTG